MASKTIKCYFFEIIQSKAIIKIVDSQGDAVVLENHDYTIDVDCLSLI